MKSNSVELETLISKLKNSLAMKLKNVDNNDSVNIKLISIKIESLEEYAQEIKTTYLSNPTVMTNFRKRVEEIKKEIESLN